MEAQDRVHQFAGSVARHILLYCALEAFEALGARHPDDAVDARIDAGEVQREASKVRADALVPDLRVRGDGDELHDAAVGVVCIRDFQVLLAVDNFGVGNSLCVKHRHDAVLHFDHQICRRRRLQSPVKDLHGCSQGLVPCALLQLEESRQVQQLGQPDPVWFSDQVLVEYSAIGPPLGVRHHRLHILRHKPGHRGGHAEGRGRDHVLSRQALHDVEVEGHAIVEEPPRRLHIQRHDLQQTHAEGSLEHVTPTVEMLHQRSEQFQGRDGVTLRVQVHDVRNLTFRELGHRGVLGEGSLRG
mmetsp:Transcript_23754/g.68713  ORF Transcript_23754/g.68713 Transcript_23754/m.68713 type:complete len:300 (+) Transcript_23754:833-1732(+)